MHDRLQTLKEELRFTRYRTYARWEPPTSNVSTLPEGAELQVGKKECSIAFASSPEAIPGNDDG